MLHRKAWNRRRKFEPWKRILFHTATPGFHIRQGPNRFLKQGVPCCSDLLELWIQGEGRYMHRLRVYKSDGHFRPTKDSAGRGNSLGTPHKVARLFSQRTFWCTWDVDFFILLTGHSLFHVKTRWSKRAKWLTPSQPMAKSRREAMLLPGLQPLPTPTGKRTDMEERGLCIILLHFVLQFHKSIIPAVKKNKIK